LLAALPEIRRTMPDVELAVVGVQLDPCPPGVTCYFNQPREKTIELMRAATLFAMPALCEPNGIVYPEALASNTPVLGLDRLAFPEFAGGGKYGFIVKEPDAGQCARAVLDAFSDPQRLRRMGEEGQKFAVENYRWERTAKIMAEAIAMHIS
jgi:glycosyltransferase involved in cell wall biosynthesis